MTMEDILKLEYILDGTQIKIGSGEAAKAAAAAAADWVAFEPSQCKQINVKDSACNPWIMVYDPNWADDLVEPEDFFWHPQITAPYPLAGISDLFAINQKGGSGGSSLLLPKKQHGRMISVTAEFFQSSPGGIGSSMVKDDLLGFFSMVLSYAKAAKQMDVDTSPKHILPIMPRSDFTTIFSQVKSQLKPESGSLYAVLKILACYRYDKQNSLEIDTKYCAGSLAKPDPNSKLDTQAFSVTSSVGGNAHVEIPLTVKNWIASIEAGQLPDELTNLDKNLDNSIGRRGITTEKVPGTNYNAPLFEFRDPDAGKVRSHDQGDYPGFETFTKDIEKGLIAYYTNFKNKHPSLA